MTRVYKMTEVMTCAVTSNETSMSMEEKLDKSGGGKGKIDKQRKCHQQNMSKCDDNVGKRG